MLPKKWTFTQPQLYTRSMDELSNHLSIYKEAGTPATSPSSLRAILQKELVERCKKNPRYSLRAFSRQLGVSASLLSRVLAGARDPSKLFTSKVLASLRLDPNILIALQKRTKPPEARMEDFRDLMVDQFEVLSDWVHYAIFELMETKSFQSDPKWISIRLGISQYEVQMALDRLESLKLIDVKNKVYIKIVPDIATTTHEFSTLALRQLQRQFLDLAAKAMDEVSMEQRSQTTMTMAIDSDRVPQAKELIRSFRYQMIQFLQETKNIDEVYNLTIGFYPLTKIKNKTGAKK